MLTVGFILSILIQVGLPVLVALIITRRYQAEWRLLGIGAAAYLLFQVIQPILFQGISATQFYTDQIRTLSVVYQALMVGFVSALVEQAARTGAFWYTRKTVVTWKDGLAVASGYAGAECILIGLQFLINFAVAVSITNSGGQGLDLPAEKIAELQAQISAFWAMPWYMPLAAALQRLAAFCLQLALGLITWQAVTRRAWVWIGAALLWQTALTTVTIVLSAGDPDLVNMLLFVLIGAVNAGVIYWFYRKTKPA